ncbi:DNA polymerase subunit gamma-2 isoform X2 [Vanacampus margaritifer]
MFSHFVLPRCIFRSCTPRVWQHTRGRCGPSTDMDHVRALLQLFVDRHFISSGHTNVELFKRGTICSYGPLGTELRENVLHQWWRSMTGSKNQVFGINTPSISSVSQDAAAGQCGHLRVVEPDDVQNVLEETEPMKEQLARNVQMFLQRAPSLRTSLIQGSLEQFVPIFESVNRKIPFGIAETGSCFQPSKDDNGCRSHPGISCVVLLPSNLLTMVGPLGSTEAQVVEKDFSISDVPQDELEGASSRGVKIFYKFPWGQEPVEVLWSRGDSELLQFHKRVRSKLQSRDGRKSIPHVVSITGNINRGLLAFLANSLQLHNREDTKQKLQQRKVLKLHPLLAPIKVALGIGRGATMELRQVCEGLLQELKEAKISAWPGYLETSQTPMEQLNSKYDEMGVLFTAVVSENTLESGLLHLRSRDTTIKETMHVSELNNFLCRYISAADNL